MKMMEKILDNRLIKFEEKLDKHGELLSGIAEQNKTIFNEIQSLKKKLFGNGQEGISITVANHSMYFKLIGTVLIIIAGTLVGKIFNLI